MIGERGIGMELCEHRSFRPAPLMRLTNASLQIAPEEALTSAITPSLVGGGWINLRAASPSEVNAPPRGVLGLIVGSKQ